MTYPPIYHVRCTICHVSSLAVGGFDPMVVCPTCARLDLTVQVDWLAAAGWTLTHIFARDRTPWVDAPGNLPRLFPLYAPAGFLKRLCQDVTSQDMQANVQRVRFVVPGLSHQITWNHTPWCPGFVPPYDPCDPACQEVVTYARVAVTGN